MSTRRKLSKIVDKEMISSRRRFLGKPCCLFRSFGRCTGVPRTLVEIVVADEIEVSTIKRANDGRC